MDRLLNILLKVLPLVFAVGFLVPVFNETLIALNVTPPMGISTLALSFLAAGSWGLAAQARGRWV